MKRGALQFPLVYLTHWKSAECPEAAVVFMCSDVMTSPAIPAAALLNTAKLTPGACITALSASLREITDRLLNAPVAPIPLGDNCIVTAIFTRRRQSIIEVLYYLLVPGQTAADRHMTGNRIQLNPRNGKLVQFVAHVFVQLMNDRTSITYDKVDSAIL